MNELSAELERARTLEERAHRIRMAVLRDEAFMAGLIEGYEQSQRGETISQADLDAAIKEVYPDFSP